MNNDIPKKKNPEDLPPKKSVTEEIDDWQEFLYPEDEELFSDPLTSREEKKKKIRKQTLLAEKQRNANRRPKTNPLWKKWRNRFFWVALAVTGIVLFFFLFSNYEFSTYASETLLSVENSASYETFAFGEDVILVTNDSVSLLRGDTLLWTEEGSFQNPICAVRDSYFALREKSGYRAYVFDETGLLTTIQVSRPIRGMDISAYGVTALVTESDDTAYISYFDRYGSRINVEVKSVLDISGYPIRIALSPDGQRLLVLYYSVRNGIGESRLSLYDFRDGKAENNYIIANYENFYDSNTYLADCRFFDDDHAVCIGTDRFLFLSDLQSGSPVRTDRRFDGEIESLLFAGKELHAVIREGNENRYHRYDKTGKEYRSFSVPAIYDRVAATDSYVAFLLDATLFYFNTSGQKRYESALDKIPLSLNFLGKRSLLLNDGDGFRKITLH